MNRSVTGPNQSHPCLGQAAAQKPAGHRLRQALSGSTMLAGCASLAVYGLALALVSAPNAYALPTGGQVAAGNATIAQAPGVTTVTQASQKAVINWQSFSIGQGEAVQFAQPNSQSVALNRVIGADPSSILGRLSANGKVFLVNPNGILFGSNAQVNVAGLVGSTLDISDANFMAGRYVFSGSSSRSVRNQGSLIADGGYVALLGAEVSNNGLISARLGSVALAGGQAVTLDMAGDQLLNIAIDQGAMNAVVQNGGLIQADGGHVILTTQAAGLLLKTAVNNTGRIEAKSIDTHGGTISLSADLQGGVVNAGGTLDVSGLGAGQTAGTVQLTGYHVGLFDAHILASGDAGGGTVLVGGDFQGTNLAIPNASATYMSAQSTIAADAVTTGNGGKVVLWSNDSTRAYGAISARGGALGGDGGLIETSGHWLDVTGITVNASAPSGKGGIWLLDPADVTIGAGTTNGTLLGGVFTPNAGVSAATVDAGVIQTTLNGGSNVTITTVNNGASGAGLGNITVTSALVWTTSNSLTLAADNNVIINPSAAITASTQNSKIIMTAGNDVLVNAALVASAQGSEIRLTAGNNVTATAAITATGLNAEVNIGAGNNISVVALTADGGGTVTSVNLHANQDVIVNGALSAAGGNVLLRADDDGTGPGVLAGTVRFTGPGAVVASTNTAIRFNPDGYANTATEIANYVAKVTGALDARAWVFALGVDRPYNGLLTDTLQFRNPTPADNPNVGNNVTLNGGTATFVTKDVGTLKTVNFSGYTLGGPDLARFDLYAAPGVVSGTGTTTAAITPVPLIVTADDHAPKPYGATVTFAGTEYTSLGLVNSETIGGVTLTSAGGPPSATVGTYAITPSDALSNGAFAPSNYTITYVDGSIAVVPVPLIVTANDHIPKPYGDLVSFAGTEFTSLGLVNGETIGSVTLASAGAPVTAPVASYAIAPSSATGGTFTPSNYTVTYLNGTIAVIPIPLVVTANSRAPKTYGDVASFTGTEFSSLGLVNSETVGSVTLTSAAAPADAPVGTYAIAPSSVTGGSFTPTNYVISYVNGSIAVVPVVTPPVVTPPVIIPPVVMPLPGTTAPGSTPPGSTPPGSTPTETTPTETTPTETTPGDTPVELTEATVDWPSETTLDVVSRSAMGGGGSRFAVVRGGVLMPPMSVAPLAYPQTAPPAQVVPPVPNPQVPPERPRKQDRY